MKVRDMESSGAHGPKVSLKQGQGQAQAGASEKAAMAPPSFRDPRVQDPEPAGPRMMLGLTLLANFAPNGSL